MSDEAGDPSSTVTTPVTAVGAAAAIEVQSRVVHSMFRLYTL